MKIISTFLLLVVTAMAFAQSIERDVVSSNGEFYSNSTGQLSTTLGEPVIETVSSGTSVLTQGFQQSKIVITAVEDHQTDFEMNVYPNPTQAVLTVKVPTMDKQLIYSLYSVEGKLILSDELHQLETKINVEAFSKGNYFLNISTNKEIIKSYQIIKE